MFTLKPDFEQVLDRFEAWWEGTVLDRALTSIRFPRPFDQHIPFPEKIHATFRDRWMNTEFVVERAVAQLNNVVHYADALPITFPNLGPEVFSAFYGCPLEFGETTSWSEPILADWTPESVAKLQLDTNNVYFRKILEMTDALLEAGKGNFIVGYTDIHAGGDGIAAFRDPQKLCIDMIEHPAEIKALTNRITADFLEVYDPLLCAK